jgi:hypothetical protein
LRFGRQALQKRVAPDRIQFAKNVVDQHQGRRLLLRHEDASLGDLQGQRYRSLLTFRCKVVRHFRLDEQFDVIAMRTDDRLAKAQLLRVRIGQVSREVGAVPGREPQQQHFSRPTDLAMRRRGQRRQALDQLRAHRAQFRAVFEQGLCIGRDFARARMGRFQKGVARAERAFVGAEGRAIKRIDLGGEKIEIAPAGFGTAAHQLDVGVGKRDHAAQAQIFIERTLFDLIERHLSAQRTKTELQTMIFQLAGNAERFFSKAHRRRERRAALRLQS